MWSREKAWEIYCQTYVTKVGHSTEKLPSCYQQKLTTRSANQYFYWQKWAVFIGRPDSPIKVCFIVKASPDMFFLVKPNHFTDRTQSFHPDKTCPFSFSFSSKQKLRVLLSAGIFLQAKAGSFSLTPHFFSDIVMKLTKPINVIHTDHFTGEKKVTYVF